MFFPVRSTIVVGEVEIDPALGCVRRAGRELPLRRQTFEVLLYLLDRRERLVTKQELIEQIWRGAAVTDDAVVQCIVDIRKTLGDDCRRPRFIKTIPKAGYRFIAVVEEGRSRNEIVITNDRVEKKEEQAAEIDGQARSGRAGIATLIGATLVVFAAVAVYLIWALG